MSVTHETVAKIANLARIRMDDAEIAKLVPEFNNILAWVEQLGEVDTSGVEPMTAVIENHLRLRDDVIDADPLTGGGVRDAVLANAPAAEHGFYGVPKVIGRRSPGQVHGEVPITLGTPFLGAARAAEAGVIGALHAGWKGATGGIAEATVAAGAAPATSIRHKAKGARRRIRRSGSARSFRQVAAAPSTAAASAPDPVASARLRW